MTLRQLIALTLIALTCSAGLLPATSWLVVPASATYTAPRVEPPSASHTARSPTSPSADRVFGLPPPPGPARYAWPLTPPHPVVRSFQPPSTPYGPGHRGVDLGSRPDAAVLAVGDGMVVFAGPVAGRGVVSIAHEGGLRTTYEPLTVVVAAGQRIGRGTVIGLLAPGHDGCVVAACLHWGARRGTEYVDPLGLLSTGRVRLLPWEGDG